MRMYPVRRAYEKNNKLKLRCNNKQVRSYGKQAYTPGAGEVSCKQAQRRGEISTNKNF